MDLDKHRAISYCGFKRCHDLLPELRGSAEYSKIFSPLWLGNWLTDINQAATFFSFLPDSVQGPESDNNQWFKRCFGHQDLKRARRAKEGRKTDYYQNRKNGGYVLPPVFATRPDFTERWERLIAALWQEEWRSAQAAWAFSRQMGELPDSLSIDRPTSPAVTPGRAEEIGCYYPLDHFDVADQEVYFVQQERWGSREELELDAWEERGFMTATAQEALEYARQDWVKKAFDATRDADRETARRNRLADYQALKLLGHGLHTLQDFYAHSNYSDLLLICMADKNLLPDYWNRRIHYLAHETGAGTFNAFVLCREHPSDRYGRGEKTPLVTGRFDPVDTVHTLLRLAIDSICGADASDEEARDRTATEDRLYRILFGTFSDIDIVRQLREPFAIYRDFSRQIDRLQAAISRFFLDYLVDPAVENILQEQDQLIDAYLLLKDAALQHAEKIREYRRAGELLFHQRIIEQHLRNSITTAERNGEIILPHHALLAKDRDPSNDAVKLSYKLSCALAAEVSTEVLVTYFQGAEFSELEPLLARRYVHPKFHVEQCAETGSLNRAICHLNGKWFHYALHNPENGQSILGFNIKERRV